jgi:hypothetical protein
VHNSPLIMGFHDFEEHITKHMQIIEAFESYPVASKRDHHLVA